MYGQIHVCIRSLILKKFGQETWDKIVKVAKCDEAEHFMVFHNYGDDRTVGMVGAVAEVLNVPIATVLELFGEYFFTYCLENGYDKMLRTLGDNFVTFIQNLDSLHSLLAMSYKSINAPSFRCEAEEEDGSVKLHYYSKRKGLYPIVTGLLRTVSRDLFNVEATPEVIDISEEIMADGTKQDHVTFHVMFQHKKLSTGNRTIEDHTRPVSFPDTTIVDPKSFCNIFPFHVVFGKDMVIKQCGINIQRMASCEVLVGSKLTDVLNLMQPNMAFKYENILKFINAIFILELNMEDKLHKAMTPGNGSHKLILKGQMMLLGEQNHIIFIGSPRLSSLNELQERNLYLSDIPLYDVTRELVLLNQQRIAEIEVSKKLDETTAELMKTARALEQEKKKTDTLLYQMLPEKVANSLREGYKVAAEKFEEVTILFSDIVTFTNIAAAVQPIDIVNMLNALYSKFDALTNVHGVYKVETIGDAYMVVGGIPDVSTIHAQRVGNFALDMVKASLEVKSPATGKPLQIRVGIHTGPVVAGVVGEKMPRYCLFGDTVNTASRMESHGQPARIHCSPTTQEALAGGEFEFETRGEIEVKGKGLMCTYFLLSSTYTLPAIESSPETSTATANHSTPPAVSPTTSLCALNGDETAMNGNGVRDSDNAPGKSEVCVII